MRSRCGRAGALGARGRAGDLDLAALELGELLVLEQRRRLDEAGRRRVDLDGESVAKRRENQVVDKRREERVVGQWGGEGAELLLLTVVRVGLPPAHGVAVSRLQRPEG